MKDSIIAKLESLKERYEELEALLGDVSVISDQDKFRAYSKEYSQLEEVVKCFNRWTQLNQNIEEAEILLDDPEMKEMAQMEIEESKAEIEEVEQQLQILLLPKDPNDEYNCYLEIRAGTGGDEAGIFAGDLFRMYSRYAESKRWRVEMLSANESEQGGYKEVIVKVSGDGVYGQLKFESGGHRVQRVPKQKAKVVFIPLLVLLQLCQNYLNLKCRKSIQQIYVLIPTVHLVRVVSTLIQQTLRYVLPIFQQVLWWNVRMNVRNIKTKLKRCLYWLHVLFKPSKNVKPQSKRIPAVTY